MKLSGKSLEQFEKWYIPYLRKQRPDYIRFTDEQLLSKFRRKQDSEKYGVLVDFFDSLGVKCGICEFREFFMVNRDDTLYKTRHQARAKAIERANKIYNNR